MDSVDEMWLFATYLSNALGKLFTLLPGGDTYLGMNCYCALIVASCSNLCYFFTQSIFSFRAKISRSVLAFVAQIIALNVCWAPGAMLYNYLTYLCFLASAITLYIALLRKRPRLFYAAGLLLGINMGVRFSNLVQVALVLPFWYTCVVIRTPIRDILRKTFLCIAGFLSGYGGFLLFITARYGISTYINGIARLFSMTSSAPDYTFGSMLMGMVIYYRENMYWVKWMLALTILLVLLGWGVSHLSSKILKGCFKAFCILSCLWIWFTQYQNYFFTVDYVAYNSFFRPYVWFLNIALLIALIVAFNKASSPQDKLFGAIMVSVLLLSSLGGNTAIYASINNSFLTVPYVLWMSVRWLRTRYESKHLQSIFFPIRCMLVVSICVVFIQTMGFGVRFVYAEAAGVRGTWTSVTDNPALKGIVANPARANALSDLSRFVYEHQLDGKKCLLYGQIPGLSFYLRMPPALNSWSDLLSYDIDSMKQDLEKLTRQIDEGDEKPIIILHADQLLPPDSENQGIDAVQRREKRSLIFQFIQDYSYQIAYQNDQFVLYQSNPE
jgi:hypothetical protein